MNRARQVVRAEEAVKRGITGKSVGVAVLDTGVYPHPDLKGQIICFHDILYGKQYPYDDCSHGTHVSGILCGTGQTSGGRYKGIAPGCHLISVKVLDKNGNGNREDVMRGLEWVIRNKNKYNIRIINISVGTERENDVKDMALIESVEKAWDAGLIVVVAAGNMGPEPMSITAPGNSRKVITVGSSDDFMKQGLKSNKVFYSGRGPTRECILKPDVVAPGSTIISCNSISNKEKGSYCTKSGTSMATPMISGGIALLLSIYPEMTNVEVKMKLRESTNDYGLSPYQQGWGVLDIGKLLS